MRINYPEISIEGDACYSDHRFEGMAGVYFRSNRKNKKIHKRFDGKWQKCVICGKYYEKVVIYNSSSMENDGVGTFGCLCSAPCMLEYVISHNECDLDIDINSLWNDEDLEKYLMAYSSTNIKKKIVWDYLLKYLNSNPGVFTKDTAEIWELVYKPILKPDALFRFNFLIKTLNKYGYKNLEDLLNVTNKYLTGFESNICGKIFILNGLRGDNKKSLSRRIENAGGIILGNKTKAYIYADYLVVPRDNIKKEKSNLERIKHKSNIKVINDFDLMKNLILMHN